MAVHKPVNGTKSIPWSSSSSSSRRRWSLVDQIRSCQNAWCPGAPWDRDRAHAAVLGTAAGSFLIVCDSSTSQPCLLCVCTGEQNGEVLDFMIQCTDTVFQLSQSHLCFSDLAQLVLFYSLTRDVLPVCLSIPPWIHSVNEMNEDHLEPSMWLISEQQAEGGAQREPVNVMCSTLLTSTNGALCIINPLYLREHGDEWLTPRAVSQPSPVQVSVLRRERRLSTTRSWAGSALMKNRSVSVDEEPTTARSENSGVIRARSADSSPLTEDGVVLRRVSIGSSTSVSHRLSTDSLSPSTTGNSTPELQRRSSPVPQSPHRVSWIEDGIWLPPPRLSSLVHPPSLELDSLSVSSIEEEQEPHLHNHGCHHPSAHRLAGKVMHRLSAVGQVLGGLVSQKKKLTNRVVELSERKDGDFAESVKDFVDSVLKKGANPHGVMGSEFLQEVRSMLTSLRETLFDYPEILLILESFTDLNDSEIDSLVEVSLHKVTLKPVSTHIYACIHTSRTNDGTLDYLRSNQCTLQLNAVDELGGSADVGVPDSITLERIQQRWTSMHETYSPNKKVEIVLKVCKTIYHSMTANTSSAGKVFGADDFLPCLTWVLLRSDLITLQIDTDYMMELLDPTQLQGEGGYYLTTLYAALFYISSFRPRLATRQLSVEAQQSLNQWHRRRTLHCNQSRHSKNRRAIRGQGKRTVKSSAKTAEKGSDECQPSTKTAEKGSDECQQQKDDSTTDGLQTLTEETPTSDHQPVTSLNIIETKETEEELW